MRHAGADRLVLGIGVGAALRLPQRRAGDLLRLPPFIVTLGTWNIFFALNLWYSASETIRVQDIAAARRSCSCSARRWTSFGAPADTTARC